MPSSRSWSGVFFGAWLAVVAVALATAHLGACGADEGESCPSDRIRCIDGCVREPVATLDYIQNEIINPTCNIQQCHGSLLTKEELPLTSAQVTCEELIGVESVQQDGAILVVRGNPDQSYLMNKLTGVGMAPFSTLENAATEQMPNGPAQLCQEQVDIIRDWIAAGAPGCP